MADIEAIRDAGPIVCVFNPRHGDKIMRHFTFISLALALAAATQPTSALADEQLDLELTLEPDAAPGYKLSYEEYRLEELERTSKRSRNALIGTSAAAAVGLLLVIPAASSQCSSVEVGGESDYQCTSAGDTLLKVGSPLVIGGLTGALVSGIILGVRKGKMRRLNDSFQPTRTRAVRWDERSSRFVF
jgi:hypothetical protein